MTTIEAIEYLEEYNAWRRGLETMPPNPTKIGKALDIVLTEIKTRRENDITRKD